MNHGAFDSEDKAMIRTGKAFDYKEVDGLSGFDRAAPENTMGVARRVAAQV